MGWTQDYTPLGNSLLLSSLAALIPILYFFWALAIKRMKGHTAGLTTLLIALVLAVFVYGMPAQQAVMSASQGAVYGLLPIGWIIVTSVFLYKLTVKTGQFEIIRSSVLSITDDRRLQALLIAFSFGAFLEGAAGFGAPVAISAALLVGLGFNPLYAAGICLIANTAPVAFGAIGIPIIAVEGPTGIPAMDISKMVGRQLPFLSVFIPFYLIIIMSGFKRALEVLPAILVSGVSFAVTQYVSSNFLGPELPDILSAIVSLIALAVFLKFWKPKTTFRFSQEKEMAAAAEAQQLEHQKASYSAGQIFKAWTPFLLLTAMVSIWGIPSVKQALTGHYEGSNPLLLFINDIGGRLTFAPGVPFLHNQILDGSGKPLEALYKLDLAGSAGTAILIAAVLTKFVTGMPWKEWGAVFTDSLKELGKPILTIASVVGFAYVTNSSGMSTTLGMSLAMTGSMFAFFSPVLGWLGVFITGSDTSANLLFGSLQKMTAQSVGMEPVLSVAANSSGGVTGKMISPQSIAVACAAVGLAGKESDLLRFTLKHSLFLLFLVCMITFLQHHLFSWMIP
ncbi:L-lactate permease LutP [Bacillus licheniformis]|jgi:lactate permease|uniref:L-lactate permease n=2 Tax=Bacillus licheniformis TaxID=1402 RepID=Q65EL7_BACLD|nr:MULTISPECIES: L-lactate permease LutP [Bacillus]MBY8348078.1 L-lactate permease [Bacillus sp. PCH94]MDP4168377.1 L-lactate permease LutP [Bacillota bacterium]AAU25126.1 putative L-lactate permease YvfH [Bacillus licheniformis DSM 13 = ATCC 14580]AAU42497.1 L-lactate permease LutP [Bacillus licheniformis DSM 13 = ATCC 14580]AMR12034.1 lactate permease [Bacillus licheniformis]